MNNLEKLDRPKCPFCGKIQTQNPVKSWKYLRTVKVSRYGCACGRFFHHYISPKNTWTIPKQK